MNACLLPLDVLALAAPTTAHAAALLCAAAAHVGAILAVLRFMLSALVSASLANLGAGLADRTGKLAAACHEASRKTANLGAVDIESNAVGHHFDVIFLQAGAGTCIAGGGASVAGVDAGLELIGSHGFSFMFFCGTDMIGRADTGWRFLASCQLMLTPDFLRFPCSPLEDVF